MQRAGEVLARSPACLAMLFAFSKVICLRRGRGDVMGLRPLRSPLPTPRSTPLGFPGGHCSHGSVGSWEEPTRTTLARKGRYEGMTFGPRPALRWAVLSRAASGDEPWANGALDVERCGQGQGSDEKVCRRGGGILGMWPLCAWREASLRLKPLSGERRFGLQITVSTLWHGWTKSMKG